jgi:predicted molibdopterin-dependent oxidoreductase YjgC
VRRDRTHHPGRLRDPKGLARGPEVRLTVDGRQIVARSGESVAAAMMADDVLELRLGPDGAPRGLFCGMGVCFDCLVIVDGVPSTRACITFVTDGMAVQRQDGRGEPCGPDLLRNGSPGGS